MEKLIFFRHRHAKENNELVNAFKHGLVNKYVLNKLRESVPFDFTDKNINKAKTKMNTDLFHNGKYLVNFLEAYMLDGNKVVAHQIYLFDETGFGGIMIMETLPEYRRRGIAEQLLTDCEEILFDKIGIKTLNSTATNYSKDLFKKHGYNIQPHTKPQHIMSPLNPSDVEVKMTRERYNIIKSNKTSTK